jgi:Ca2+-binding EF-hand superfamily protein
MYYTHKKYAIEKQKLKELNKLFDQYDLAELGRVSPKDARTILRQVQFTLDEAEKIVMKADPEQRGSVRKELLFESIRQYLGAEAARKEMIEVYHLMQKFSQDANSGIPRADRGLTLFHLRDTANSLGEFITERDLREMMEFAEPNRLGCITMDQFLSLMSKTSIW